VILLEAYRGSEAAGQYSVTFEGTLDACLAETHHDGNTYPLPIRGYSEANSQFKELIGSGGRPDPGRIVGLVARANAIANARTRTGKKSKKKPRLSTKIKRAVQAAVR
jgi:hypothetical protein